MISLAWRIGILVVALAFAPGVHGAQIEKVKGKSLLINLEGDTASSGDLFYTVDPSGKKRGILRISKVARGKAIAVLGKGKAEPGWMLEAKPRSASAARSQPRAQQMASDGKAPRSFWGVTGGVVMDSVSVDLVDDTTGQATGESVDLKGTTFALKGLFDYQVFDLIWFRGLSGIENLDASGSRSNGESRDAQIMYLTFDFWGRAVFGSSSFRPWAGAGFSLMFPMSKKSSALREASITNTSTMAGGFGVDWFLSPTSYVPISLEYGLFPESQLVKADYIALRVGWATKF